MFSRMIRYGLGTALCLLTPLTYAAARPTTTTATFQVPGSIGTYPQSMNNSQTLTGFYLTSSGGTHGFLRTPDGVITTFDVPGSTYTQPVSINDSGVITGVWQGPNTQSPSGFVRAANGTITTLQNKDNNGDAFYPQPVKINASGEILGNYPGVGPASHMFTLSPSGTLLLFSLGQSGDYPSEATGLSDSGAIVGYGGEVPLGQSSGFIFPPSGPVQSPTTGFINASYIDVPGSYGTFPTAINASGTIVGCYSVNTNPPGDSAALTFYDFEYQSSGTFTTLSLPGTVPSCVIANLYAGFNGAAPVYGIVPATITIDDAGTIVGTYTDASNRTSGFMQTTGGTLAPVIAPGASATTATSVNSGNDVAGYFVQSGGTAVLGFVQQPVAAGTAVVLTVSDAQGYFWDGGNSQRGGTILQVYQDYPSTGQNWTWTPVPGGFTICDLGTCLSDSNGQVVMSTKADVFTITNASAVLDVTTGLYIQNASKPANAAYLSTGATASPWNFSLNLH
jgi:hypothetical protein